MVVAGGGGNNGRLGVRAAYMLIRNLADVQGLSMKVGRQYVVFGNHSLFGHFDWANTGYSHDGVMFAYQTKTWDSYFGWFRNSETDIGQAAAVGSGAPNIAGTGGQDANRDADMFIFYNQFKMVPGMVIEPFYVYYKNQLWFGRQRGARSWHGQALEPDSSYARESDRIAQRRVRLLKRSRLSVRSNGSGRGLFR